MKLKKVHIKNFKNLSNFEINFEDNKNLTTVLVGQNATGKSNFLEAIVLIFRWLHLNEDFEFYFDITYECNNKEIRIIGNPDNQKKAKYFAVTGNEITHKFFLENKSILLPKHIFAYYSGLGNIKRLEEQFEKFEANFLKDLLNIEKQVELPPLFFAKLVHSNFALLSLLTSKDEKVKNFLQDTLGIEGINGLLFVIRQRQGSTKIFKKRKDSNPIFWNAGGDVALFLDKIYKAAYAPMRAQIKTENGKREAVFLYLSDIKDLIEIAESYGSDIEFFKYLNSMHMSDLLESIEIDIQKKGFQTNVDDELLNFKGLSEGEQQLLTVLGLLRFFREEECLFLLDEPDTHLNPAWKYNYIEYLNIIADQSPKSQILMTTHEALVVKDLEREQIQMFTKDENNHIHAALAPSATKGMSVDMILTNPVFGLNTTINAEIYGKILRQRELVFKRQQKTITADEETELQTITNELNEYGYYRDFNDPLFEDFKTAYLKQENNFNAYRQSVVSKQEEEERQRIAEELLRELFNQDPTEL